MDLSLPTLRAKFLADPRELLALTEELIVALKTCDDPAIFIARLSAEELRAQAEKLLAEQPDPAALPLWGVPFAVKDNIDVAGFPTTAACPDFAFVPERDAHVVGKLKAAGALVIGKTNLDQFATGLNGTRSPFGAPRSAFNKDYISGGSSSGSAVAVAKNLVSFSLGTDTAGSGRVPAAFNDLVGIKPTPGLLSSTGVVPACRSLDCVSIFTKSVADGVAIRRLAEGFDQADAFSCAPAPIGLRPVPRLGVLAPKDREFFGDSDAAALYDAAIAQAEQLGWAVQSFDYAPFAEIAALLYEGPWIAERFAAIEEFFTAQPQSLEPTVRGLIEKARNFSASDLFKGQYRLKALLREAEAIMAGLDALLLPTAPTIYTVAEMLTDPLRLNARLGLYTNFVNFCGQAAIAIPAGFRPNGLPFGVTLIGPPHSDEALAPLAAALHGALTKTPQALGEPRQNRIELLVVGAHLAGQPLNFQLTDDGGFLVETTRTAPDYRLFALAGTVPPKPGLIRAPGFSGPGLEVEIWSLTQDHFGRFVAAIPAPLGVGKVTLADGRQVTGFLCESHALDGARDITAFGGWRAFRANS